LKTFVRGGGSFKAKLSTHDDLVMSTLLTVRMLDLVLMWSNSVGDLREIIEDEEIFMDGMPVVF
jgi:hypothetical protein